jgi:hypothetical protein
VIVAAWHVDVAELVGGGVSPIPAGEPPNLVILFSNLRI